MRNNNNEHICLVTVFLTTALISFLFVLFIGYMKTETVLLPVAYLHIRNHNRRHLKSVTALASNNAAVGLQWAMQTEALLFHRGLLLVA